MSRARGCYFLKCPKCGNMEMMMFARKSRRKNVVPSLVIAFHSRQFTKAEVVAGNWWCASCDRNTTTRAVDLLDSSAKSALVA
jgi:hypothetical protein